MTTRLDGECWIYEGEESWISTVQQAITCKGGGGSAPAPAGNTTNTTTSVSAPWSGQQPYLTQGFQGAQALYNQGGPAYYPGQTLASVSPYTTQGINQTAQIAQNDPTAASASNLTTNELNGNYLNNNPYLDQTYNQAADQLQGQMRSAFGGSDVNPNTNSSLQAATGTGLASLGNQIYGTNYQQERTRQDQALALAPQTEQSQYTAPSQLMNAGLNQQALGQQGINDQINRYNYTQNLPYLNLQNYMQMINGSYGGTNTTTATTPYYGPSTASNVIGGGLAGAGIGSMIPGVGSGYGALGGGLLGGIK